MSPSSTKLKQFLAEISDVQAKYQYAIEAQISYTSKGIIPQLTVVEVIPPKKEIIKKIKKESHGRPKPSTI